MLVLMVMMWWWWRWWWWWWSRRWQTTCPREFGREEHISGRWIQPEVVKVTRSKRKTFNISFFSRCKKVSRLPINSTWLCQSNMHIWKKKKITCISGSSSFLSLSIIPIGVMFNWSRSMSPWIMMTMMLMMLVVVMLLVVVMMIIFLTTINQHN